MRRLFGRRELDIMEKQMLGVSLSPSEKTRLSRDIKPKLNIILKMSNFSEEFGLKKSQKIKILIKEAREVILESKDFGEIKRIYVFGSYVDNKLRMESDIDIAVEFVKISSRDATKFVLRMGGMLSEKIQVSVLNVLPEKIKAEVLNKGRVIYGKS
ncbi:MAG: nucleotidyltransferase domain-containing protein [Nanoarchaeota archaeon]|nr:nucleotidyltransferase domain-containing protein [Nanoarchaeota archaeon]